MRLNQNELKEAFRQAQNMVTQEWEDQTRAKEDIGAGPDWETLYAVGKQRQKHHIERRPALRIAMVVLLVLVVGAASVFSVEANRKVIIQWFTNPGEKVDDFHFAGDKGKEDSEPPQKIEKIYGLSYVTAGFERTDEGLVEDFYYSQEYVKGKKYIVFEQSIVSAGIAIDSEKMQRREVTIRGCQGQIRSKKGTTILIWTTKNYVFMISSNLGEEEVIKMAEGVREKKKQ